MIQLIRFFKTTIDSTANFMKPSFIFIVAVFIAVRFIEPSAVHATQPIPSLLLSANFQTASNVATNVFGCGSFKRVCIDGTGNLFVSGYFRGELTISGKNLFNTNHHVEMFAARLNSSGDPIWLTNSSESLTPVTTAANPKGGMAQISYFHGPITNNFADATMTSTSDWGALVLEINPSGNVAFSFTLEENGTNLSYATTTNAGAPFKVSVVSFDKGGNLYVGGDFIGNLRVSGVSLSANGGTNDQDYFLAKWDTNGVMQWLKHGGSFGVDQLRDMAIDGATNIFIMGQVGGINTFGGTFFPGTTNIWDGFVIKLDSNGNLLWEKQSSFFISGYAQGCNSIVSDGNGGCYVTGSTSAENDYGFSTPSTYNAFVAHLDALGNPGWTKSLLATNGNVAIHFSGVDTNGNIYVAGNFDSPISLDNQLSLFPTNSNENVLLAQLSASGNFQWARMMGVQLFQQASTDKNGNSFVLGQFSSGDYLGYTNLAARGNTDTFINKIDPSGQFVWTAQIGAPQGSLSGGLLLDNTGGFYVHGFFLGTNYIQDYLFTNSGTMGAFLTHIVDAPPRPRIVQPAVEGNNFRLYWQGGGGFSYIVQSSTNLSNGFQDLSPVIILPIGITATNYLDLEALDGSQSRFYRVRSK